MTLARRRASNVTVVRERFFSMPLCRAVCAGGERFLFDAALPCCVCGWRERDAAVPCCG